MKDKATEVRSDKTPKKTVKKWVCSRCYEVYSHKPAACDCGGSSFFEIEDEVNE